MYLGLLKIHHDVQAEVLEALGRPGAEGAYRAVGTTAERLAAVSPDRSGALGELARAEGVVAGWLERPAKPEEARRFRGQASRHRQEAGRAAGKGANPPPSRQR